VAQDVGSGLIMLPAPPAATIVGTSPSAATIQRKDIQPCAVDKSPVGEAGVASLMQHVVRNRAGGGDPGHSALVRFRGEGGAVVMLHSHEGEILKNFKCQVRKFGRKTLSVSGTKFGK
jgi:hypothetical protein